MSDRSLRVVQLVQKPQLRGAEIFAAELSSWLRRHGHQVATCYLYSHQGDQRLPLGDQDEVLEGREFSPLETFPGFSPHLLNKVRRFVNDFDPDVIQVNGARTIKYGAFLKRISPRKKWVLVYRNIDSPRFWVRDAKRRYFYQLFVMPQVEGVIGVSEKTTQEVLSFYRLDVPCEFIPNGVNLEKLLGKENRSVTRESLATPKGATVVLFFGSLSRQKRPDRFLRVLAQLGNKSVYAWILGDGPLRRETEFLASTLGISDRVRFLGYQSDVASFLWAADILLSASDTEGIPAAVIEASACGLPVVGFDVGGMPECVKNETTGLLAPHGREDLLVENVRRLVDDEERRREMSASARAFATEHFSIESVGPKYLDFYRKVLGRSRDPDFR